MVWIDQIGKEVNELDDNVYGFIYQITYSSGKRYLGKKKAISVVNKKAKKNGEPRKGHVRFFNRIVNRKRTKYEEVKTESNWREYEGSSEEIEDGDEIVNKMILLMVENESALTYFEAKLLFAFGAIEGEEYYNKSILGRFFNKSTKGAIEYE